MGIVIIMCLIGSICGIVALGYHIIYLINDYKERSLVKKLSKETGYEHRHTPEDYNFEFMVTTIFMAIVFIIGSIPFWGSSLTNHRDYLFNHKQQILTEIKKDKDLFGYKNVSYYKPKIDEHNSYVEERKKFNNKWWHTETVSEEEINFYLITQSEIDML